MKKYIRSTSTFKNKHGFETNSSIEIHEIESTQKRDFLPTVQIKHQIEQEKTKKTHK